MSETYLDSLVKPLGYPTYNEYLASDHWIEFTTVVRKKRCFCCGDGGAGVELHVHHITYGRIGCELPEDVVTLCRQHHVDCHWIAQHGVPLSEAHILLRQEIIKNRREKRGAK